MTPRTGAVSGSGNVLHNEKVTANSALEIIAAGALLLDLGTTVANLGMSDVRFPKPVFHGDTIHVKTTVISTRRSKSRADAGIVEFEHEGLNQAGETVAICRRAALMKTRAV